MIVRVEIENLVIVQSASFEPGSGLTAITGETGAGKTLLATAIDLLFGGDADARHVGPGAAQAWVEGEFEASRAFWEHPDVATLAELRPEPHAPLVLARRVESSGRSRALAWGRTVTKADLAAAGRLLVATAGQHVQVRLRSAEFQRATLDGVGGASHQRLLGEMATAWAASAAAQAELERVQAVASEVAARAEQLRDDLARIDAVAPSVAEEAELVAARDRARHHQEIVEALAGTAAVLDGDGGDGGAIDLAGHAYARLLAAADVDPSLAEPAATLLAAQETMSDVASQLASRLGELVEGPAPLDELEERLAAYDELKRAFGGTVESVVAAWQAAREQVELLEDADGAVERARLDASAAHEHAASVAARLTASRCACADELAADVRETLDTLGMAGSVFRVGVEEAPLSRHGADRVTMLLAPAAGIEPQPVAQVASGGELSRIALALLVATTSDDGVGTILFDEIDAGIGGHTAHAVASTLRRLADRRQVLCITHLPQVAARADSHVVIEKADLGAGVRTTLRPLGGEDEVVEELLRMLGAGAGDDAAREHVRQLRGPRFEIGSGRGGLQATAAR